MIQLPGLIPPVEGVVTLLNRAEMIPLQLFYIDVILLFLGLPFIILLMPVLAPVIALLFVLANSFGAYDPFMQRTTRLTIYRLTLTVLGLALLCVCLFITSKSNDWIFAGVAVSIILLITILHSGLRNKLTEGSQHIVLVFHPDFKACAQAIRRHIMKIGYPADVTLSSDIAADPCRLPVTIQNLVPTFSNNPKEVNLIFDPMRFCDVALRVLPPEALELRPSYVSSALMKRTGYAVLKRIIDLIVSITALLMTLPLWIITILGILIFDGSPIFFGQARVGYQGNRFRMLKFRTLRSAQKHLDTPTEGIEYRKFPFGNFLRQLRIDELPQLLMVLSGSMSLVGPRPEMEYFHTRSTAAIPFYDIRLNAKPGLTGWAQVCFPHSTTEKEYRDKTAYDLWYVTHRSTFVDLKIILRTIGVLCRRFGSK